MLIIELIIGKKIFGRQNVGHQKFLIPNNLKSKKHIQKNLVQKCWSKEILSS